jgi:hypothetical protein
MTFSVAFHDNLLSGKTFQTFKNLYEFGTTLAYSFASDEMEGDEAYEKIR